MYHHVFELVINPHIEDLLKVLSHCLKLGFEDL